MRDTDKLRKQGASDSQPLVTMRFSERAPFEYAGDADAGIKRQGKYVQHFIAEVNVCEQNKWPSLQSIFVGSTDIGEQLPDDSKRFAQIDADERTDDTAKDLGSWSGAIHIGEGNTGVTLRWRCKRTRRLRRNSRAR